MERVGELPVQLTVMAEIDKELTKCEEVSKLYTLFYSGLEEMANEEWVVFRNKIPKLDGYLENFLQKIEEKNIQLPAIAWLRTQVESYKVNHSNLQHR